jgi:hypothetical protein
MSVDGADGGPSTVTLTTDFTVAGRIANFGRGVMEDVSKRLVSQMADCIKSNLETEEPAPAAEAAPEGAAGTSDAGAAAATSPGPAARPAAVTAPPAQARPVNALSLFFAVLWDRIRRLFGRR